MSQPKKILVAPLGWGLGHATRCIPIVRELLRQGAEVVLASDGRALALLRLEFPDLPSYDLPSYDVQYRSTNMAKNIASQLPKIGWAILQEHLVTRQLVNGHGIHGIISDNRYGCFVPKKRCIFLTHQVNIPAPYFLANKVANFFNHLIINQFDECWVPDLADEPNLSGKLSHPAPVRLRQKVRYIGVLSRMVSGKPEPLRYDAIAVLSGPEPQRSLLETALIEQLGEVVGGKFLLVQGKPEQQSSPTVFTPKNVEIVPSMTAEALNRAMLESGVFIGRSGYSTVMDLARLGMPALLIPTPGQPEQEYLAEKLAIERPFFAQKQSEMNLVEGVAEAKRRSGLQSDFFDEKAVEVAVTDLLRKA